MEDHNKKNHNNHNNHNQKRIGLLVAAINPDSQLLPPPKGTENIKQDHLPSVKAKARADINETVRLQTRHFVGSASPTSRASHTRNRLLKKA
jgi:hypothetical protein